MQPSKQSGVRVLVEIPVTRYRLGQFDRREPYLAARRVSLLDDGSVLIGSEDDGFAFSADDMLVAMGKIGALPDA